MYKKQLDELNKWLDLKLEFVNTIIKEAKTSKNYGKETQYQGMKDAYIECINQLKQAAR